jgi:hypothetical protein
MQTEAKFPLPESCCKQHGTTLALYLHLTKLSTTSNLSLTGSFDLPHARYISEYELPVTVPDFQTLIGMAENKVHQRTSCLRILRNGPCRALVSACIGLLD